MNRRSWGCTAERLVYIRPSISYIKMIVRERVRKTWNKQWKDLESCRQTKELIDYEPSHKHASALFKRGREGCRKIIALITGHNHFKYHVFKRMVNKFPNISSICRFCDNAPETSFHLLYDCESLECKRREFIYSPDNPKTGPDWYRGLAKALGIWDYVLDRFYMDLPAREEESEING